MEVSSRVLTATSTTLFSIPKTHHFSPTPLPFRLPSFSGCHSPPLNITLHPLFSSKKSASLSSSTSGDIPPLSDDDDVILLNVSGMMCEGCASSVKRILENQTQVSSATVNLATETATVWPISEAKVAPNWQKVIGEELAKNLTNSGFNSILKGEAATEGAQS
uniref:copper-transporting ATPase PAA1, chloroplastic-like n=1 Tax=Erigeron canadensis TaxID=72917 RepID=UPI001CB8B6F3|nr:copper-transporting ATPase PAA1, chloroplastic-like [Erigeron canadensis]